MHEDQLDELNEKWDVSRFMHWRKVFSTITCIDSWRSQMISKEKPMYLFFSQEKMRGRKRGKQILPDRNDESQSSCSVEESLASRPSLLLVGYFQHALQLQLNCHVRNL